MTNLTLKQLRYFEALSRHSHFGRAADDCAISQPALSVQVRELEASLGLSLIDRSARTVRLTDFGAQVAARARDILRAVDELGDMARAAQEGLSGRLRIGVIPTIAPYLLPDILSRLAKDYPDLDVHVRETLTQRLIAELLDGSLDAAIVALPISEPALTEFTLFSERLFLVRQAAAEDMPAPDRDALVNMRLLLLEEGHCFRDQALSFCSPRAVRRREGLDASSLSTLVQMVAAGLGVTLIPEMALGVEIRSAQVVVSELEEPQPIRTIGMVWRKTSPLAERFEGLANVVRMSGEEMRQRHMTA